MSHIPTLHHREGYQPSHHQPQPVGMVGGGTYPHQGPYGQPQQHGGHGIPVTVLPQHHATPYPDQHQVGHGAQPLPPQPIGHGTPGYNAYQPQTGHPPLPHSGAIPSHYPPAHMGPHNPGPRPPHF